MTVEQIESFGITTDSWETLRGVVRQINFSNGGSLWPNQMTDQYYFDTTSELLYVRYTKGRPVKDTNEIPEKFLVQVPIYSSSKSSESETLTLELMRTPYTDSVVGKYHEVYSFSDISAIIF